MEEELLDSKLVFDGKFIKVRVNKVRLPDGNITEREMVERKNGVSILPINDNYEALLVKQYRHAHGDIVLGLPGGGIEDSDKDPIEAAQRELFEETGYKAKNLELLFERGGSGTIKQKSYHFLATELYKPEEERNIDPEEFLEVHPTKFEEVLRMAWNVEFQNPSISLMILLAEERLKKR